jgi:glycosidase
LKYLALVYKYWIAYLDIDGYRIDTVKHMGRGPVRYFTSVIHEFTQSIGKEKLALRRGRQYLREISGDGIHFGYPQKLGDARMFSIVPWSRIFNDEEIVCAINTDPNALRSAWMYVDNSLHNENDAFRCLYSANHAQEGEKIPVKALPTGAKAMYITLPAAGFVIYEKEKA